MGLLLLTSGCAAVRHREDAGAFTNTAPTVVTQPAADRATDHDWSADPNGAIEPGLHIVPWSAGPLEAGSETELLITLTAWRPHFDGHGRTEDLDWSADEDFGDASDVGAAIEGRAELRDGAWGAYVAGLEWNLDIDDVETLRGEADMDGHYRWVEAGLLRRMATWRPEEPGGLTPRLVTLDLYGGARLVDAKSDLDQSVRRLENIDDDDHWVDPMFALRVDADLADRWNVILHADGGGFDIGAQANWSFHLELAHTFELLGAEATVQAGYKVMNVDYDDEKSGDQGFEWNLSAYGPTLSFVLRF